MQIADYQHKMAAHCESGAISSLLAHAGRPVDEAMVFGLGSGIFFGYFNSPELAFPTIVLRSEPGELWKRSARALGAHFAHQRFDDPDAAQAALDAALARGTPAAVQVDFFYMDYVPAKFRAHFNAHFIVVVGKEGDDYLVSDSYAPATTPLPASSLRSGRSAQGRWAPGGHLITLERPPADGLDPRQVRAAIKHAARRMLYVPLPFLGTWGIRTFARKVVTWPRLTDDPVVLSHELMKNIVVALEERGTGGGGFRFLYATFLQQAAVLLDSADLAALAREMMDNGDRWRDISLFVARMGRDKDLGEARMAELGSLIHQRAVAERDLFKRLVRAAR